MADTVVADVVTVTTTPQEPHAVLCVSANMHDSNNNNNHASSSSSPQEKERKRIPWVDWCRTQSVYNVVAGHAWWTAVDHMPAPIKDNCTPFCGWKGYATLAGVHGKKLVAETTTVNETWRMIDYTVDIGTLHTVPMFFLVSGLLCATATGGASHNDNFLAFAKRRVARLILPFVGGALIYLVVQAIRNEVSAYKVVTSHLWFLWALTITQICLYPLHASCRLLKSGRAAQATPYVVGATVFAVAWAVFGSILKGTGKLSHGAPAHILPLPLANVAMLAGSYGAGSIKANAAPAFAAAASVVLTIVLAEPRPRGSDEFDWLSENVYAAFSFVLMCYSIGHYIGDHIFELKSAWASTKIPKGSVCVLLILLSSYWPFFTYWAESTSRRNAFLLTFYDGGQRAWAVIRSWAWMGGTVWFAVSACDHFVLPLHWHNHLHAFSMILYIFHYISQDIFVSMLRSIDGGIGSDPARLCFLLIALNFAASAVLYALFAQTRATRVVFGLPEPRVVSQTQTASASASKE